MQTVHDDGLWCRTCAAEVTLWSWADAAAATTRTVIEITPPGEVPHQSETK